MGNELELVDTLAFTLIELLVVISLVAILAALLMAGLMHAREKADSAVCRSNLRQIIIGLQAYLSDANAYPPYFDFVSQPPPPAEPAFPYLFHQHLMPYVGASWPKYNRTVSGQAPQRTGVYVCPGYGRLPGLFVSGPGTPWGEVGYVFGAYGYNFGGVAGDASEAFGALGLGGPRVPGFNPLLITRESDVVRPADMIAFGDTGARLSDSSGYPPGNYVGCMAMLDDGIYDPALGPGHLAPADTFTRGIYQRRHGGLFNMVFCDGHIESGRPESFFIVRHQPWAARRWNKDNQPHLDAIGGGGH